MHLPHINPVDIKLAEALQLKINQKTKPLGALGVLESLALKVGLIQQSLHPKLHHPKAFIFAGDHGITAENISLFPQAVTAQMVLNFVAGGAAINVFAKQMGFDLEIVDAGVNAEFASNLPIQHKKIAKGTQNFLYAPAMSHAQCLAAMQGGEALISKSVAQGSNVFAFGEMGIGNTTSAAAIMSVLCGLSVHACTGRGTGLDNQGLLHKTAVIEAAIAKHQPALSSPLAVLTHLGGLEIAMMVGAMLSAASHQCVVIVDGFICSAAALVATKIQPNFLDYCVFSHASEESGHQQMLQHMDARPILDLNLRLGEGTGAVLAYPLLQAAVNFLNEMASFETAKVSQSHA